MAKKEPEFTLPSASEPVRPEVKRMSGFGSKEEMAASLRENTNEQTEELKPRRTRRTKAEMQAARGETPIDPNMADPRYRQAIGKMNAFGGPKLISGAFSAVGVATGDKTIPLNPEEKTDVDDYFYVLSKRYNVLDPTRHWITMALYFFGMLGTFIFSRILASKSHSLAKQITSWFTGEETGEQKHEATIDSE